jgi:hypothetical protein
MSAMKDQDGREKEGQDREEGSYEDRIFIMCQYKISTPHKMFRKPKW